MVHGVHSPTLSDLVKPREYTERTLAGELEGLPNVSQRDLTRRHGRERRFEQQIRTEQDPVQMRLEEGPCTRPHRRQEQAHSSQAGQQRLRGRDVSGLGLSEAIRQQLFEGNARRCYGLGSG